MHCFQYPSLCFQYPKYVSNIQIMFPNAFLCFQYPICVSNIRCMFPNENDVSKLQCFQSMFPIYIEPVGLDGPDKGDLGTVTKMFYWLGDCG